MSEKIVTRRQVVRHGIAVVSVSAAPLPLRARSVLAQTRGDAEVLKAAIGMEQAAEFAYTAIADSGKLGRLDPVARLFAQQEQEHAGALTRALRDRGGSPPAKPMSAEDVPGLVEATAGSAREVMAFAGELETAAVAAYYNALAKLEAPELLSMAASIMANEAQHLAVLRESLGRVAVPEAFVTGGLRPGIA
jgi:rubrerythrin